jgi:4-diphosphocytidyl-2-C-methyl-D-erythritol kinase
MPTVKLKTPAKINLLLSVLKKGLDNYHEIETVFQAISLYDIITFEYHPASDLNIRIKTNSPEVPTDSTNLVYKATERFLQKINKKADIRINLNKNIPVAAGLAGGSTDAACVLRALNKINNYPLNDEELKELGSSLGADVVFFLQTGTALGKGIGNILQSIPTPELDIVLIKPKGFTIKSGWAYEKYDQLSIKPPPKKSADMIKAIEINDKKAIASYVFNSLEYAVLKEYPELRKYKEKLINSGCYNALLSGSGPTFFGIAPDEETAISIKQQLEAEDVETMAVKTISKTLQVT